MFIILLRHGQSVGNVLSNKTGIIHGRDDDSVLTSKGRGQMRYAADLIRKRFPTKRFVLWFSPVKRVKMSSLIIREVIKPEKTYQEEALYDVDFGEFEGKSWQEIRNKYSDWIKRFKEKRYTTPFPKGESIEDLHFRLARFIRKKLTNPSYRNHLLVTHEEIVRAFLSLFHQERYYFHRRQFKFPNASLSVIYTTHRSLKALDGVILQLGRKDLPERIEIGRLKTAFFWLKSKGVSPDELLPRKNYSENSVFTARFKNKRETVKVIPEGFRKDVKKDIEVAKELAKCGFPVPKFIDLEEREKFCFQRRSYLPGKIAEEWLNSRYKIESARLMGRVLSKLHHLPFENIAVLKRFNAESWKRDFLKKWIEADLKVVKKVGKDFFFKIERLYKTFLQKLYVDRITFLHNDFSSHNIAFTKKGERLEFSGVWDFERSFVGHNLWDLGVAQKISFLKRQSEFEFLLKGYFGKGPSLGVRSQINFYTLINTTGAIRYRLERKKTVEEEVENLAYVLENLITLPT